MPANIFIHDSFVILKPVIKIFAGGVNVLGRLVRTTSLVSLRGGGGENGGKYIGLIGCDYKSAVIARSAATWQSREMW